MSVTPAPYAGFYPRMLAHNIDLVLLLPLFYLAGSFISNNQLLLTVCWLLYTLYHIAFEMSKWKGTPGKKLQHMHVATVGLSQAMLKQVIVRNCLKVVSILPLFAGVVLMAVDSKHQGLHDRLARTVVIFSRN